jgi:hypothetical protein
MLRTYAGASALLVFLVSSTSALADATLVPGLTFTARSGPAGTSTTDIGAASDEHAVSFLSAGESWDVPCWLRAYKSDINVGGDSIVADFDRCTTTSPNKTVGWLNNEGVHVYGIQVCTHASNDRLKGIRLVGGAVQSDGTFDRLGLSEEFERTNCNDWHSTVYCPVGQVATKVRVHHTGDTINGLSLGCREVTEL